MAKLTGEQLRELLPNARMDSKGGNVVSDCPFCGKEEHFGVAIDKEKHGRANPFRCLKCDERGSIFKLLKKLGRLDLLGERTVDVFRELETKKLEITRNPLDEDIEARDVKMPFGFKPLEYHPYLASRGFEDEDYAFYGAGYVTMNEALKDYVVLPVNEGGACKGYVARSTKTKEEIDAINRAYKKEGSKKKHLRWRNTADADFDRLLGGIDEVTADTHTVLLVEGTFGKTNMDRLLQLRHSPEVKCLTTFGKTVSDAQLVKLIKKGGGVRTVIMLHDNDAVAYTKGEAARVNLYFQVLVGYFPRADRDSGDVNEEELFQILENLESPLNFTLNKLAKQKLTDATRVKGERRASGFEKRKLVN